jgi:hypothetical protein
MTARLTNIICHDSVIQSFYPHMVETGERFRDTLEDRMFLKSIPVALKGIPDDDYILVLNKPFSARSLLDLRFTTESGKPILPDIQLDLTHMLTPKGVKDVFAGGYTQMLRTALDHVLEAPPPFYAFMDRKLDHIFGMELVRGTLGSVVPMINILQ